MKQSLNIKICNRQDNKLMYCTSLEIDTMPIISFLRPSQLDSMCFNNKIYGNFEVIEGYEATVCQILNIPVIQGCFIYINNEDTQIVNDKEVKIEHRFKIELYTPISGSFVYESEPIIVEDISQLKTMVELEFPNDNMIGYLYKVKPEYFNIIKKMFNVPLKYKGNVYITCI